MGGVLAACRVAVKRQNLPCWPLTAGRWLLLALSDGTEKTAFSALRRNQSSNLDQSREQFRWSSLFPYKPFLVMGGRALLYQTGLLVFFCFCFCFLAFDFLFWTDGAQYVGELKPQTTMSTLSLSLGEVAYSSQSKYDHTSTHGGRYSRGSD